MPAVQVLLRDVLGQLAMIDHTVLALAAGKAIVHAEFWVDKSAIVTEGHVCQVTEEVRVFTLKEVC